MYTFSDSISDFFKVYYQLNEIQTNNDFLKWLLKRHSHDFDLISCFCFFNVNNDSAKSIKLFDSLGGYK